MTNGTIWDLNSFFPEFNGSEMNKFKTHLKTDIEELIKKAAILDPVDSANLQNWENVLLGFEELLTRFDHISSYVSCLSSTDAQNEQYTKAVAEMTTIGAEFEKIEIHIKMGFKSCDDQAFSQLCQREKLNNVSFFLAEMRLSAQKTMNKELETLATDLGIDGFESWGRLYDTLTGKLNFEMHDPDGTVKTTPIAQCRSIMQDPDRRVRKSAFINGNKAWESVEDVCAAMLNAISGTRLFLNGKRGYNHFLEIPLDQSRISQKTLDSMFAAIRESSEFIQRIGKAKAKALGQEKLAWYDCEAPLPIPSLKRYTWQECLKMVKSAFAKSYPELGNFFADALEKKWVESEARTGKLPGAYCTGSSLIEESRIFMTFAGSLNDVSTLAHEMGHAFHSHTLKGVRPLLKQYPMTLAETASTFAEMILADGILSSPESSDTLKLEILTEATNQGIAYLIDIPIRFNFEKAFHEERMKGEVSVSKLKELMVNTMKNQFGDLLEEDGADPMFWASKIHFYCTDVTFYNFPYSFGYLLSRGFYGMFKKDKEGFLPKYKKFLELSGSDMAHIVASKTIGADLEEKDFWKKAILSLEEELTLFEELVPKVIK